MDDSPVIRGLLEDYCEELGHEVVYQAEGVEEAVKAHERFTPDVTLLDLSLLDGSGLDVLRRVRAADDAAIFLVISANAQPEMRKQVLAAGAHGMLAKPVDLQQFRAELSAIEIGSIAPAPGSDIATPEEAVQRAVKLGLQAGLARLAGACAIEWDEDSVFLRAGPTAEAMLQAGAAPVECYGAVFSAEGVGVLALFPLESGAALGRVFAPKNETHIALAEMSNILAHAVADGIGAASKTGLLLSSPEFVREDQAMLISTMVQRYKTTGGFTVMAFCRLKAGGEPVEFTLIALVDGALRARI